MSNMSKVSMALDDVIKADRKANKGNKNGKKGGAGTGKRTRNAKNAAGKQNGTAQLVKKLVKRALAQRGVGTGGQKPKNIRKNNGGGRNQTIVKKIVRRVSGGSPVKRGRGGIRKNNLGVSQRSRTIVRRRVVPAPQPTRTIVREVRYIRERPAPRVQQRRVIYQEPRQSQRVVYVNSAPPRRYDSGGSSFSIRRGPTVRRNNDPFYEPRNFLQRVPY